MSQADILANAGQEVLDSVTAAIESGDFSTLSTDISAAVTNAANGFISQAKHPGDNYTPSRVVEPGSRSASSGAGSGAAGSYNYAGEGAVRTQTAQSPYPRTTVNRAVKVSGGMTTTADGRTYMVRSPFQQNQPSKLAGIGRIICGSIGAVAFAVPTVITAIVGSMLSPWTFIGTGICGVLTALSALLVVGGVKEYQLVQRYYTYSRIVGDAEYVKFSDLSTKAAIPETTVRSDITRLRQQGYLNNATTDKSDTTLMLTDRVFKEYTENEARRAEYENEQRAKKAELLAEDAETAKRDAALPENAQQVLRDGKEYLLKVRNYNDEIPDEEMSTKLYALENIMKRIFEQVRTQPNSARELRRFMNYYLPTTDKLLGAYVEAEKTGSEGENITSTKREIENALDMINGAFEQLLNNLFETKAWDVSSDISVMKTMMAQDGLV